MAAAYEARHVHEVYNAISWHFSSTRYKPWPIVSQFLQRIPCGWVGVDVGCGNGKYLHGRNAASPRPARQLPSGGRPPATTLIPESPPYLLLGLDISVPLLSHAPGHSERLVADASAPLPLRPGSADFAISIATIHHLSTIERRKWAVMSLIEAVRPARGRRNGGRVLIYVWALEQGPQSRRRWEKGTLLAATALPGSSESPRDEATDQPSGPGVTQDVFVPWTTITAGKPHADPPNSEAPIGSSKVTLNRYYHLFRKGELQHLVRSAAGDMGLQFYDVTETAGRGEEARQEGVFTAAEGYEADNWWIELLVN